LRIGRYGVKTPFSLPMKKPSISSQVLAVNAVLIIATVFAASVAARLNIESAGGRRQFLVAAAAILATVLVNGLVLRRRFQPLERLIDTMERVDLSAPGVRAEVPEADSAEVIRLHHAFNRMLARLESERSRTASAVLRAQEDERARIARDLHDEANQALTGVALRLRATAEHAPPELVDELRETQVVAAQAMEELLRLARELRPSSLDDHGLNATLRSQVDAFSRQTGVEASLQLAPDLGTLNDDEQLVVYRVVQESLSNIARHSGARSVRVELGRETGRPVLRVVDDGLGFTPDAPRGLGLIGMRERAMLTGGRVEVRSTPGEGTTVELRLGAPA